MSGSRTTTSFSLLLVMTRKVRCSCLSLPSLRSMTPAQCHKGLIESIQVLPEASVGVPARIAWRASSSIAASRSSSPAIRTLAGQWGRLGGFGRRHQRTMAIKSWAPPGKPRNVAVFLILRVIQLTITFQLVFIIPRFHQSADACVLRGTVAGSLGFGSHRHVSRLGTADRRGRDLWFGKSGQAT